MRYKQCADSKLKYIIRCTRAHRRGSTYHLPQASLNFNDLLRRLLSYYLRNSICHIKRDYYRDDQKRDIESKQGGSLAGRKLNASNTDITNRRTQYAGKARNERCRSYCSVYDKERVELFIIYCKILIYLLLSSPTVWTRLLWESQCPTRTSGRDTVPPTTNKNGTRQPSIQIRATPQKPLQ